MSKMSSSWRSSAAGTPANGAGGRAGRIGGHGRVAVRAIPGRDPVAPPQLAADVPVAHLGQPVLPDLHETLRQDLRPAGPGGLEGGGGQRRHADEPLRLEPGLDDVVGALAATDQHVVRLGRVQIASSLERLHDPAARLVAVQSRELGSVLVDASGVVEDRDHRQAVALAGVVVVLVVRRCDLDRARPERSIDDRIGDDRHRALAQRGLRPGGRRARHSAGHRDGRPRPCHRAASPAESWRLRSTRRDLAAPVASSMRWYRIVQIVPFVSVGMTSRSETLVRQPGHQWISASVR